MIDLSEITSAMLSHGQTHPYEKRIVMTDKAFGWGGKVNKFFQDSVESRNHENNG